MHTHTCRRPLIMSLPRFRRLRAGPCRRPTKMVHALLLRLRLRRRCARLPASTKAPIHRRDCPSLADRAALNCHHSAPSRPTYHVLPHAAPSHPRALTLRSSSSSSRPGLETHSPPDLSPPPGFLHYLLLSPTPARPSTLPRRCAWHL